MQQLVEVTGRGAFWKFLIKLRPHPMLYWRPFFAYIFIEIKGIQKQSFLCFTLFFYKRIIKILQMQELRKILLSLMA